MKKKLIIWLLLIVIAVVGSLNVNAGIEWKGNQGYNEPSAAIQKMLDMTVFIEIVIADIPSDEEIWPRRRNSNGSGVIIDAEKGIILTSNHIIDDIETFFDFAYITTNDGNTYCVDITHIQEFPEGDLALLTIGLPLPFKAAVLTERVPGTGEAITVVGSPYGKPNFNTVSHGIVSGIRRKFSGADDIYFIQTDAAINPGSSGGPWVDKHGRVFAITARSYRSAENLGYGVPLEYLRIALGI